MVFLARTVPVSGCPQLIETNEIRVQVVKGASSSFKPEMCGDHMVKIAGCRSYDSLEFLITCASYTDVKSFACHGSWEEDGRNYLITGLRNTGYKYCFGKRWEASDPTQGVLLQNRGETELNRSVTCMVLKATANDRRHLALSQDEYREP
ncbi:uncharacterized protein TNCV_4377921 [Trichonephila clavipes]|nr:uncharacterized protein TNCV_4377921 [Trichonephila clavipes]